MTEKEFFEGICPYTDKHCEDWNCSDCMVEQEEQKYLKDEPKTVNDKINAMSIEEKSIMLSDVCKYICCDGNNEGLCNEKHSSCFLALCDSLESEVEDK